MHCDDLFPVDYEAALHLPPPMTSGGCQSSPDRSVEPHGAVALGNNLAVKIEQSRSRKVVQSHCMERQSRKRHLAVTVGSRLRECAARSKANDSGVKISSGGVVSSIVRSVNHCM
jgi:hypothetical protein